MTGFKMSWVSPKIFSKKSQKSGFGVFAKKPISENEIITIFGGYVINIQDLPKIPDGLQDYYYQISDKLFYGPVRKKDIMESEFFNHSCNPNSGFKDSITLIAIKDIKKNEEVTFDYAMCMTSGILNLKCQCGEKKCRKIIKGSDWKKPELQKKYKNYFQPYIKEKIEKN